MSFFVLTENKKGIQHSALSLLVLKPLKNKQEMCVRDYFYVVVVVYPPLKHATISKMTELDWRIIAVEHEVMPSSVLQLKQGPSGRRRGIKRWREDGH